MKTKLLIFSLLIVFSGLINASGNASPIQVIVMDERPIGSPILYIGYKMTNDDQSLSTNIGKIEVKSGNGPVNNKFMLPGNAKAMTFDTTQKNTGNFYISYTPGQGYKLTEAYTVTAVYSK